jgi:hypothetical protein
LEEEGLRGSLLYFWAPLGPLDPFETPLTASVTGTFSLELRFRPFKTSKLRGFWQFDRQIMFEP